MKTLRLRCPAKLNLHLRVLHRRADGYHDLITLMQPVELSDEVTLEMCGSEIRIECSDSQLPHGEGNLAVRAARLYQQETGDRFGVIIRLNKSIPVAAGLGGGSSDAAGVLMGLNELRAGGVPRDILAMWGARLGADVPFFLCDGPAVATGIGDQVTKVRIVPSLFYVILFPGWPVATKWVYENLDLGLTESQKKITIPDPIASVKEIVDLLHNDLESVTTRVHPWIDQAKARLLEHGALGALMSGSGPTVFGVFADEVTAQTAWEAFRSVAESGIWCVRGIH